MLTFRYRHPAGRAGVAKGGRTRMSGTLSFAAGQVFIGTASTTGATGEVALTEVGTADFSTGTPPAITSVTITQDVAASATATPFGPVEVTLESVTIDSVDPAASVVLTTDDLPPGITIPPGFTLPQTVEGTTLHVTVHTNQGDLTGDVGVFGYNADHTQALVVVQDLVALGATFDVGAAILSLGPQTTGDGLSDSFTPAFSQVAPCFAAGTRIATAEGVRPVELLAPGDVVRLATGGTASVCWVGQRRVACDRHPRPEEVWPVRIEAGAIAEGVPARDLWLSPDHAVALGGVLVPARYLVNGASIRQEKCAQVTYFHVELADHALLLAEGLEAESYLDTGNRAAFANAGPAIALHPRFAPAEAALAVWRARGCLPLVLGGEALGARRAALHARALALGWRETAAPALRAVVEGRAVPLAWEGAVATLVLPAGAQHVTLASRRFVPAEHQAAPGGDTRVLGAALAVRLDGETLPEAAFTAGWHAPEDGAEWRWTEGVARLVLQRADGERRLALHRVAAGARYWLPPRGAHQAAEG